MDANKRSKLAVKYELARMRHIGHFAYIDFGCTGITKSCTILNPNFPVNAQSTTKFEVELMKI